MGKKNEFEINKKRNDLDLVNKDKSLDSLPKINWSFGIISTATIVGAIAGLLLVEPVSYTRVERVPGVGLYRQCPPSGDIQCTILRSRERDTGLSWKQIRVSNDQETEQKQFIYMLVGGIAGCFLAIVLLNNMRPKQ
ncbi:hypothetical protein AWQ22_10150 [Picosynechococcus sp. PCC 7117]|nr:hypothetical protein AWQ22_10150 [Picosynechococcus sp. PCC 7117]